VKEEQTDESRVMVSRDFDGVCRGAEASTLTSRRARLIVAKSFKYLCGVINSSVSCRRFPSDSAAALGDSETPDFMEIEHIWDLNLLSHHPFFLLSDSSLLTPQKDIFISS